MFELDFRNFIVLLSLSIQAGLLWVLYRYGRKTASGRAYFAAILAIAGWVFPMVLYRSHLFGEVEIWARLLYIMALFTSVTFFYFTLVFPDDRKVATWIPIVLMLEIVAVTSLLIHPDLIIQNVVSLPGREDIIKFGPLYPVYTSHISLFFLAGFVSLFLQMRRTTGVPRQQIRSILVGYFLASNLAMTTNLILPGLGYFELNWIGQLFSTIVAIFTTYAIFRYKFMDIRIIATEGFLIILNFFLFLQMILSKSQPDLMLNGGVFVAVIGISLLLIRSIQAEIRRKEELARLAESLEKANIRLKELDQQKTEFLSIASHQLRTPLSILKGYIELIQDAAYGKPSRKLRKVLSDMNESNERLVKLVDEFLDITRIEQGRTKYVFENKNINEVIDSVLKELVERAEKKDMSIEWKPRKVKDMVYMDEEKIRHVIFNYVDNAIKYSEKGTIRIKLENKNKDSLSVHVIDQGLGFNREDEVSFFNKFYRGKNVEGINVNGTGLGIYVCRQFVEAHGGEVMAKSPGLGKGSDFSFWIPLHHNKHHDKVREVTKEKEPQHIVNQYTTSEKN